ncbi:hypothetical protein FDE76_15490 [Clostridium botulinum]|uniref:Uncharacterized protein n=1 Tax=Clostridium botulinum (strain Eklund 17B / Type B) TaxID=935198 RepID=B2TMX1_CLOBB|nr:hypothetical protein CLL_A1925 [Clostridium botulinum B str. Eklund 17B (NRP)]MBY6977117.1 hypothetical protein [Clostridium botulinum]MBY6999275.1 hypothetical protein [Clostridium botulinum]MCR1272643.1 hypothetical protein [Clostridium botulinum]NFD69982.1 hypothetical protein [Clostridium botulinum]
MKCDRNKLKDILKVNLNTLKQIERRNNLQIRLRKVGYDLVDKHKEKNKYIYEIKKTTDESYKKLKNIINSTYNSNRADKFVTYFNIRTLEEPNTVKDIATASDVTEKTIIKWDNTLKDKRILSKDGYYYFRLCKDTREVQQCTIEEYKSFWKNKAYINAFYQLQSKYMNGEITLTELQLASGEIAVIISTIENKYYFKVKKYKVNKENQLYMETKNLIDEIEKGTK